MRIRTLVGGISPYVMKSARGADPENETVQEIKAITDKRMKMTSEDRFNKARLQFAVCLYIDERGPYVPAVNFRKCLIEAGRTISKGTAIERALLPIEMKLPLIYDGPRDIEGLWATPQHRYETMVNGNPSRGKKSMISSMRPIFPKWGLDAEWELVTEALDFADFVRVAELAGQVEGLGDNRKNGLGRFNVKVEEVHS